MINAIVSDLLFAFSGISWIFSFLINFNGFLSIKLIEKEGTIQIVICESSYLPVIVAAPQLKSQLSNFPCTLAAAKLRL